MSEQEAEIREAAAVGAAAAVDAVVTEHHEDERASAVEDAAGMAVGAAEEAAEAATAAGAVAVEAHASAEQASATATEAATEAADARSEVEKLRDYIGAGFSELREFITGRDQPRSEEPTEVVVTDASESRKNTGENRSDSASGEVSSGASESTADARPYRHRFGRSR